ncbi:hypothetical protein PR202_gb19214 [Eleusine coracana subsp. coracana]|uniref:non-specific serine/threonine protein kinase n=1 Tax=Eleusine coracana subsp. coracana TaxID=191504 RepID=A0AAV5F720_ELECO|nr:hypothetical protein QOZ80_3AG0240780 [Eleusine coracana subsp. coracana]GJN30872.1 hypothetical protein PR202_gb19214 [Eleusine coracana subsp. coracana]
MRVISCVVACLSVAFLLASSHTAAATGVPAGTLQRVTKQHILASIPPHWDENPVLFLTSPSGKYAAYFVRTQTTPGAGGLGADFCFVQVLDTTAPGEEAGRSVWESDCMAVSTVNTCALVFSWEGLEVFDGSNSVWHTHNAESDSDNFLETLQLVDQGDMRILDKGGELAWKASDQPRAAQHCGMPGSPGLNSPLPTFAEPVGTTDLPFGAEAGVGGVGVGGGVAQPELPLAPSPLAADPFVGGVAPQPELPLAPSPMDADQYGGAVVPQPDLPLAPFPAQGAGQFASGAAAGQGQVSENVGNTFGFGNQPLVDNSPYDSGAVKNGFSFVGFALALGLSVAAAVGLGL